MECGQYPVSAACLDRARSARMCVLNRLCREPLRQVTRLTKVPAWHDPFS